jgi:hypothetical protein
MRMLVFLVVGSLLALLLTTPPADARYGFSFRPPVGTPHTTFSASFRAPFTSVLAFDADTSYDWSLAGPAGACHRGRGHSARVRKIVNGRPKGHGGYGIRKGDLVTYRFAAPRRGWCKGVHRGRLEFSGSDVAGCPHGAPPGCDPHEFDITIGRFSFRVR